MKGQYLYKKLQPNVGLLVLYIVLFLMCIGMIIAFIWQGYIQGYDGEFIASIIGMSIFTILVVFVALETISIVEIDHDYITVRCYRGTIAKIPLSNVRKVIYWHSECGAFVGVKIEESESENKKYKRTLFFREKTRIELWTTNPNKSEDKLVKLLKEILSSDVIWTSEMCHPFKKLK